MESSSTATPEVTLSSSEANSSFPQSGDHHVEPTVRSSTILPYKVSSLSRGLVPLMWSKVEMVCLYAWVLLQTLLLLAGLAVLHFSTFSVMICYFIEGTFRRRRELKPQCK